MRVFACLLVALTLCGCSGRRDGNDGMDGFGVAAGLRHELQRPGR
ncbi:hypothetical protein [Bosea minatitlanensis]|uniref:Lipoprotein n=1 Tax=Bosea minatitlanensis TaxID=128782 RepID=A0ABW0F107_9HYPH|nr:hypothetical protein [Bosea minatitlanensis]MCT4491823.1 hypothetical protein [Bosea minatitlanensis]